MFYGTSPHAGFLMPNPVTRFVNEYFVDNIFKWARAHLFVHSQILFIHIYQIYRIWFGLVWVLWHINPRRLFNVKSCLYIYIKYIGFGLVWVSLHINPSRLFNVKSCLYIYIRYTWFVNEYFVDNIFKWARAHLFVHS